jgi:hypothetical protein
MTSGPLYTYKVDIRSIGTTLLQVSPIILAIIYTLEYNEVYGFLYQFGVTPEEVGISEIKLLTRAALLTLAVVSILGIFFVIAGVIVAIGTSIEESRRIQRFLRRLKLVKSPNTRNAQKGSSMAESAKRASEQAESVRVGSAVSFAVVLAVVILALKPLGLQPATAADVLLDISCVVLTVVLFLGWRNRRTRYLAWASGAALVIALLGLATIYGGPNLGAEAATTGQVSSVIDVLGADLLQVHPAWIDKRIVPSQYIQNQDLLELGSDVTTTFLYDCWTGITYRIPLSDVILMYPVNRANSAARQRLHCH